MAFPDIPDKYVVMAIGLIVLLAPVVIVTITFAVLVFTGTLILKGVPLLVALELYLIDLVLFAAFAYGLYRLTRILVEHQLPASLDALDEKTTDDEDDGK